MDHSWKTDGLSAARRTELRGWALLAVGSLAVAGLLALGLGLSRTPKVQDWLPWGPHFFYRALVTHVVLSFEVWFLAALGALSAMAAPPCPHGDRLGKVAVLLGSLGVLLLLIPALADQGEPSLNNYVPVVGHRLFYIGLGVHALGVALACLRLLPVLRSHRVVPFGIACAGLAYLAALACFVMAWALIPARTDADLFNERVFWGGGHVLQLVNTMILMIAWQALSERQFGTGPVPSGLGRASFAALALFAVVSPLIYILGGDVLGLEHRQIFTRLLWVGLPLPPLVMGLGLAWQLVKGPRDWRSPAFLSLALSLFVFAIGGFAGFFLGVADTRTPSHYHAVIGGVQLGLMGVVLVHLLPALGREIGTGRGVRLQFHLYGWGQLVHALGFFLAGAAGVPRKTTGVDQGLDTIWKKVSMGVVGMGTGLAVLGGVIFVWMALSRLLKPGEGDHA
ncbi:Cytochrome c oxidase (B(O/a)3-type) chain I [Paramagnetospirillum magnetotacticum MS-1]|uniref:Cytochrome c oxidase (B(O/a)3-type) chain I n=1 Tax=Paramagnetospirillum magnetotacticum MS-1 TaxID=272627 RepID=A0A0C2YG39_PARME|nr:cbb3-type cytochrome c oxidase subunit I [Paramagnetospirillum magnetotacticum]KIL98694.1 Cytochrome c oxidase (B(O/a)3-type) chain I [Paramagnetospirillum magnetotacticum MS-1]